MKTYPFAQIVTIRAPAGRGGALGSALSALVSRTRAEEGCEAYELHHANGEPEAWMVYERWRSKADADAHLLQPYVCDFLARCDELVAGKIDVKSYAHIVSSI